MLGHELRNPLAPISTAAQLLKLPAIDENRVRYASDVIARQVDHMNRLLGDMLDVSRVTRGLVSLTLEQIDLKAVIDRAVEQTHAAVRGQAPHRSTLQLPPGAGRRCAATDAPDPGVRQPAQQRRQVHARRTAQISLAVAARPDHVVVTVQDNGEGIAPELLPRIFDLFSQGERKPDRSQGGLGLGLALVQAAWCSCTAAASKPASAGPGPGQHLHA